MKALFRKAFLFDQLVCGDSQSFVRLFVEVQEEEKEADAATVKELCAAYRKEK